MIRSFRSKKPKRKIQKKGRKERNTNRYSNLLLYKQQWNTSLPVLSVKIVKRIVLTLRVTTKIVLLVRDVHALNYLCLSMPIFWPYFFICRNPVKAKRIDRDSHADNSVHTRCCPFGGFTFFILIAALVELYRCRLVFSALSFKG